MWEKTSKVVQKMWEKHPKVVQKMWEKHPKVVQKMWKHLYFLLTFNKKQTNQIHRREFPQNTLFRSLRTSHFPLRTSATLFGSFYPNLRLTSTPK